MLVKIMVGNQLVEHVALAQFGERKMHNRVVGRGRLEKTGEKRSLGPSELVGVYAEIAALAAATSPQ